jgi:hypothetical protein
MGRLTDDLRREALEGALEGLALDVLWLEDTAGDPLNHIASLGCALRTVTHGLLRCADLLADGPMDPACVRRAVVLTKYTRRIAKELRSTLRNERLRVS